MLHYMQAVCPSAWRTAAQAAYWEGSCMLPKGLQHALEEEVRSSTHVLRVHT